VKRAQGASLEPLEARQMLSTSPDGVDPWAPYATLTGQDQAVAQYPYVNGSTVRVAVIDRGIDYNMPQLGGGIGGSKTVWGGYNFRDGNSTQLLDDYGHGTMVAGIIAASGYTAAGAYNQGVAPDSQIIDLKQESSANIKAALDWVIANASKLNIQVVNITDFNAAVKPGAFNPPLYTRELRTLYRMGVFLVAPVGNSETTQGPGAPIQAPASDPYVMGVAGLDQSGGLWNDSRRGAGAAILGPASQVTVPAYTRNPASVGYDQYDDNYDGTTSLANNLSGTSFAAAYVAGAAALIKQIDRTLTDAQVRQILTETGTPTRARSDVVDGIASYPRLNIAAAIARAYQVADDPNHANYNMKHAARVAFKGGQAILSGAKLLVGKEDVWSVTIPDTRTVRVKINYAGSTKLPLVNLIDSKGAAVGPVTSRGLTATVGPGTYYLYFNPTQSLVGTYGFSLTTTAEGSTRARRAAVAAPASAFATAKPTTSEVVHRSDDLVLGRSAASVFAA
jgi:hypothetical protein